MRPSPISQQSREQQKPRILFVPEPDLKYANIIAQIIRERGYSVIREKSPTNALARVEKGEQYDVFVLGARFPNSRFLGLEFLGEMLAARRESKFILYTSYPAYIHDPEHNFWSHGCDACLLTYIDATELTDKIDEVLLPEEEKRRKQMSS